MCVGQLPLPALAVLPLERPALSSAAGQAVEPAMPPRGLFATKSLSPLRAQCLQGATGMSIGAKTYPVQSTLRHRISMTRRDRIGRAKCDYPGAPAFPRQALFSIHRVFWSATSRQIFPLPPQLLPLSTRPLTPPRCQAVTV